MVTACAVEDANEGAHDEPVEAEASEAGAVARVTGSVDLDVVPYQIPANPTVSPANERPPASMSRAELAQAMRPVLLKGDGKLYIASAPNWQAADAAIAERGTLDVDALADELSGPAQESPDAALSESQLRADFKRALDALPAEQRDVFLLYEETGLGLEDIGRITGVAMETAKSRLRYALSKLRGALRQHQSPSLQSSVSP